MKALVTATFHPSELARLRQWMEVEYEDWRAQHKIYFDGQEFAERIRRAGANVLVVEADLVHDEVLDRTSLSLIAACRGDPINVAVSTATRKGIPVLYTPARNARAVAELTVAYMLALARNIYPVNWLLKSGELRFRGAEDYLATYQRYGGFELGGATVGLVGLGAIGRTVAEILRGFGTRVLAYDPYVAPEIFAALGAEPRGLDEMLPELDFLSVHCPLQPSTIGLIGRPQLARLPASAFVLNLARAEIIDEDALYQALVSGHLGGAALDVFRDEPVQPDNRFVRLPNVLVSPHLGGATRDVVRHQSRMVVDDIERWLRGEQPRYLLNPEVWQQKSG